MAYKRKTPKNFKLDDVVKILNDTIEVYSGNGTTLYYPMLLIKKGLYPSRVQYWSDNYPEVKELLEILRDISEEKLHGALVDGEGSTSGIMFSLRCNHQWIEEDKKRQLENDKDIAEINKDTVINIGWDNDGED